MISAVYQRIVKPWLFLLSAETAHRLAAKLLGFVHRHRFVRAMLPSPPRDPALELTVFGRRFASPLGLAAGFDKHAELYNSLGPMGFAFVEVGTITALPQPGNPLPRLFRLPQDRALINRMGFNNPGAKAAARALSSAPPEGVIVGVNLGKSKLTPVESAAGDYVESARALSPFAGYMVINVSSPNTPGLRSLQSVNALRPIVRSVRDALGDQCPPLLVKIAPDLSDEDLDAVADMALDEGLAGLVATNTTLSREGLSTGEHTLRALGDGGLSGSPLRARSTEVIARLYARTHGKLVIIGVGGVSHADHVWEKLCAGATLVQIYTAFVYEGPSLARDILRDLRARMQREGVRKVSELTGRAAGATVPA